MAKERSLSIEIRQLKLPKLKSKEKKDYNKRTDYPRTVGQQQKEFSSVAQSCPTLCDPMDCSTPALPVHHQLPEFTQTHVH